MRALITSLRWAGWICVPSVGDRQTLSAFLLHLRSLPGGRVLSPRKSTLRTIVGCAPQEEGITELLMAPAALRDSVAGVSGTRNLSDNLSDLKAQVAANNRGIQLVQDLISEYGLDVVHAYMRHIQAPFSSPCLSVCLSVCLSGRLSVCLSVVHAYMRHIQAPFSSPCLSVCLSVCEALYTPHVARASMHAPCRPLLAVSLSGCDWDQP
jgi:Hydantoinase B/oxoprolinase